jgi:hypothetical protein
VPFDPRNGPNFVFPSGETVRMPFDPNRPDARQPMAQGQAPAPVNALRLGLDQAPEVTARLRAEDARRARMAQTAEAQGLAAEASARAPTRGGTILDLDPVSGKLTPASQGIRGATPETFQNYMSSLKTAVDKVTSKQNFNLTAAEKIAWEKTKFDLAEIDPGFRALSDKAIAERMMDRKWVDGAVAKAREQARAFEEIAKRAKTDADIRAAQASREKMLDVAEMMEENLRAPRADASRKQQGPKTRAAIQNNMITNRTNRNALRED